MTSDMKQLKHTEEKYPIPSLLNVTLAIAQIIVMLSLFWCASRISSWAGIIGIAILFGIIMNSAYSLIHEAEHNLFHPNRIVNTTAGVTLSLFFPAPYHLLRQGHLGHHMRNRSDDEAFDLYFEESNVLWRWIYWYGIITGVYWFVVVCSNMIILLMPRLLVPKENVFCRPTEAVLESLNPKYLRMMQIEAALAISLHCFLVFFFSIPILNYCLMMYGFGLMWSGMQYVHHYGTTRDVRYGARNLKTLAPLDVIWLNHNYHLNHHVKPNVPWIYVPKLFTGEQYKRSSLLLAYLKLWTGPRFTEERVENRYAGRIIR